MHIQREVLIFLIVHHLNKYPTEETINENWSKIETELLKEDIQEVKYCGTSIVVLKTEKDAETVIKFYKVNKKRRYCK